MIQSRTDCPAPSRTATAREYAAALLLPLLAVLAILAVRTATASAHAGLPTASSAAAAQLHGQG